MQGVCCQGLTLRLLLYESLGRHGSGAHCSNPFPRDGSNDEFHINMIRGLCLEDKEAFPFFGPDPEWDMVYMREGGESWLTYAPSYVPILTDCTSCILGFYACTEPQQPI